jgi:hypothetical protein
VGTATQEAALLFATLADRAREHLGDPVEAGHPPECTWCPLCRALAVVRRTSPEVREQVVESAISLGLALCQLVEQVTADVKRGDTEPGETERGETRWD